MENDQKGIFGQWKRLERCVGLLKAWGHPDGILLESSDGSHKEVLFEVANMVGATRITDVSLEIRSETDWQEKFVQFVDDSYHANFFDKENDRICLVIPDLAQCPEWMRLRLKGKFENAKRPFCCIAGMDPGADVEGFLTSHFFQIQKIEPPRQDN